MVTGQAEPCDGRHDTHMEDKELVPDATSSDTRRSDVAFNGPDGGWGWIIVIAAFVSHVILDGSMYTCGVFYVEFSEYFNSSKGGASWIGSFTVGTFLLAGPIGSVMINKFGCRVTAMIGAGLSASGYVFSIFATHIHILYFTFGALPGLGFCFMYMACIVSVGRYFDKRRTLATGLAVCGAGVGTFILAPLTQWLIDTYSWKGALLVLGGIVANGFPAGATYAPLPVKTGLKLESVVQPITEGSDRHSGRNPTTEEDNVLLNEYGTNRNNHVIQNTLIASSNMSIVMASCTSLNGLNELNSKRSPLGPEKKKTLNISVLKDKIFLIFVFHDCLTSMGHLAPFVFMPDYAQTMGISPPDAAFLISIMGILNTMCRVLIGFTCDLAVVAPYRLHMYVGLVLIGGISSVCIAFCNSYSLLVTCAVFYGVALARFSIAPSLMVDLFSLEMMVDVIGIKNFFTGIMALVAPPILGWIFDATGSYTVSFIVSGLFLMASGGVLSLVPLLKRCKKGVNGK